MDDRRRLQIKYLLYETTMAVVFVFYLLWRLIMVGWICLILYTAGESNFNTIYMLGWLSIWLFIEAFPQWIVNRRKERA